jgi:hypothetical protein
LFGGKRVIDWDVHLSFEQNKTITALETPRQIQDYLDSIPYSAENINRCPVSVLRDQMAHCLDGGLFAAAALERLGFPPLLVDIQPEPGRDDDHVLAIFRQNGGWGAVAKSNFTNLRFREPVYRSLRELVMSYFNDYFSLNRERTLRYYTRPYNLSRSNQDWIHSDAVADEVEQRLHNLRKISLLTTGQIHQLTPVDQRTYECGLCGVDLNGVFQTQK